VSLAAAALILGALLLPISCSRAPDRPNVVIVVLDTVRFDHTGLGASGGSAVSSTPNLDRLATEGIAFSRAWATGPWTVPSHASLVSGLLPSMHRTTGNHWRFDSDAPTVAEVLRDAGYETAAFFSNPWLTDQLTGMLRGFELKEDESGGGTGILNRSDQGGLATVANIGSWLARRSGDRPFLMFVNFLEPHLPYDPPQSYRAAHLSDIARSDVVETRLAHEVNSGLLDLSNVDLERVRRLYAGDVHTADRHLGSVLQLLRDHGLYDDAVIIVTSDHGENLGDHGFLDHQFGVFDTLIEIPLVVRAPGHPGPVTRDDPVMITDVYATALDAAGIRGKPDTPHSRSLLGEASTDDRPRFAEYTGANSELVRHLRKLNPELDTSPLEVRYSKVRVGDLELTIAGDGSERLYDLGADPGREENLAAANPGVVNALMEAMPAVRRSDEQNLEIDEEMRERLRALGYIR
jgi:arylsulfatase A-like enzyme